MEAASTLSVQTKVLGVRLCDDHLEALLDKVVDCPTILCKIPGRKTLVRAVEEGEEIPRLHDLRNLLPLILCGVNTRRIVSAGV